MIVYTAADADTGSGSASATLLGKNVQPVLLLDPAAKINDDGTATMDGTPAVTARDVPIPIVAQ